MRAGCALTADCSLAATDCSLAASLFRFHPKTGGLWYELFGQHEMFGNYSVVNGQVRDKSQRMCAAARAAAATARRSRCVTAPLALLLRLRSVAQTAAATAGQSLRGTGAPLARGRWLRSVAQTAGVTLVESRCVTAPLARRHPMRAAADGCRHGRAVALPGSVTAHWL